MRQTTTNFDENLPPCGHILKTTVNTLNQLLDVRREALDNAFKKEAPISSRLYRRCTTDSLSGSGRESASSTHRRGTPDKSGGQRQTGELTDYDDLNHQAGNEDDQ